MKLNELENKQKILCFIGGCFAGFINGLFGGGGGMIVVPLLTFVLKYKPVNAHATAILIILPMSIISAILYFSTFEMVFAQTFFTTIGVCIGGAMGAILLSKISNKSLSFIFFCIMLFFGIKMMLF